MRTTLLVIFVLFAAPGAAAACAPATNVEGVIEDSPELAELDAAGNRFEALKLLATRSSGSTARATRVRIAAHGVSGERSPGLRRIDASTIVSAVNAVDAELRCRPVGTTFTDTFTPTAALKRKAIPTGSATSADITVSWRSPLDVISVRKLRIAYADKQPRVTRTAGRTWVTLHVTGMRPGSLRFKLVLKQLGSVKSGSLKVTTQVATYKH